MVLAAGRGERMRPLTDTTPKPLLPVRGKPLMQWPLEALARGGGRSVVVNTDWLGAQIPQTFGDFFGPLPSCSLDSLLLKAEQPGVPMHIHYSHEGRDFGGALETAGGIVRALPLLDDVFWVVAGDVFVPGFAFSPEALARFAASDKLAHLWLVPNPAHNLKGDFGLSAPDAATGTQLALNLPATTDQPRFTFSTIALYRQAFFAPPHCHVAPGNPDGIKAPLAPMLRAAMDNATVSAELYTGEWTEGGTPERLAALNEF
jgi:MurNAc alpha-1-phosphate uridylyltransferase